MLRLSLFDLFVLLSLLAWAVVLGFTSAAQAGEPVSLEKMQLNYVKLDSKNRDPYLPHYTGRWKDQALLDWRFSLFGLVYWDNTAHTETVDTGAVKSVGWRWEAGIRAGRYVDIFHTHHSRHVMEEAPEERFDSGNHFPVSDGYGIRLILIEEKKR